jgi:CheY-like chemotaxis protein
MPTGGKLTIETQNITLDESYAQKHMDVEPGPYIALSVSDSGSGMDQKTLSQIFEPFYTTKDKSKGTGLGLSTVYGIVKQSGGHIWVYSEVGVGTSFKVYLPQADEIAKVPVPDAHALGATRGTESILVVEDEDDVRALVQDVLEGEGYSIQGACDGREALRICDATEGVIDLMVTDVIMPGMSGRELADEVRPKRPEMKVLYMSGYTDDAIVHHGVLDPGTAFLQKPFTPGTLLGKVRQVLDEVPPNARDRLTTPAEPASEFPS